MKKFALASVSWLAFGCPLHKPEVSFSNMWMRGYDIATLQKQGHNYPNADVLR